MFLIDLLQWLPAAGRARVPDMHLGPSPRGAAQFASRQTEGRIDHMLRIFAEIRFSQFVEQFDVIELFGFIRVVRRGRLWDGYLKLLCPYQRH